MAAATMGASLELTNEIARTFPQVSVLASMDDFTEVGVGETVIAAPGALHAEVAIGAPERGRGSIGQKSPGRTAIKPRPVAEAARRREACAPCDIWSLPILLINPVLKHPKESTLVV